MYRGVPIATSGYQRVSRKRPSGPEAHLLQVCEILQHLGLSEQQGMAFFCALRGKGERREERGGGRKAEEGDEGFKGARRKTT